MSKLSNAFAAWLADPVLGLALPVTLASEAERSSFLIHTQMASLEGWVTGSGLTIPATVEGETWDLLLSLDVLPVAMAGGFVCELCKHQDRRVFLTVEALWRDHLFDPLSAWINDRLSRAKVLAFYQTENKGATWAELHESMAKVGNAVHVIPL